MNKEIIINFKKQIKILEKEGSKGISKFNDFLVDFYNNWTCSCFLRNKDGDVDWKQLSIELSIIDKIQGRNRILNKENYVLNLIKGFIYLKNDKEEEAYKYLTQAIKLDQSQELAYFLRSSIEETNINPTILEDARNAVLLKPCARNYFILASSLGEQNEYSKAITYYEKAIEINPNYACAYYNKSSFHKELNDFDNAYSSLKKCIKINPKHFGAHYRIWSYLFSEEKYKDAMKYAKLYAKLHPKVAFGEFMLGLNNQKLQKYKIAINYYKKYLNKEKGTEDYVINRINTVNRQISSCEEQILIKPLKESREHFIKENYKETKIKVEEYLKTVGKMGVLTGGALDDYDDYEFLLHLDDYLVSLIKENDKTILLDEENQTYKILDELKTAYNQKIESGEDISQEEENVNKLTIYYNQTILGFGKHKGEHLSTVINKDPNYILWCIRYLHHFAIDKSLFLNKKLKVNKNNYLVALEYNLIKHLIIINWEPEDNYQDNYDDDPYPQTYGEYAGTYAQDHANLSDEFINDVLGGEADAYWNID
jgi:tetratricopeptide (TPR) repeat protein